MGSHRQISTEFRRWRDRCALTQQQAADLLGLSRSRVEELDTGRSRRGGKPSTVEIDRRTRLAMAAILERLEPYHENVNKFTSL